MGRGTKPIRQCGTHSPHTLSHTLGAYILSFRPTEVLMHPCADLYLQVVADLLIQARFEVTELGTLAAGQR